MDSFADKTKWCLYCKQAIEPSEAHIVVDGDCYHLFCYKQMNTFYDSFSDEVGYFEEE